MEYSDPTIKNLQAASKYLSDANSRWPYVSKTPEHCILGQNYQNKKMRLIYKFLGSNRRSHGLNFQVDIAFKLYLNTNGLSGFQVTMNRVNSDIVVAGSLEERRIEENKL